jgi:hypothetical protein
MTHDATVHVTADGVVLHKDDRVVWTIRWDEVTRIEAYKIDLITTDVVCLEFVSATLSGVVDEETPGWKQLTIAVAERFPVRSDWRSVVVKPPFATNRSILWDRDSGAHVSR